MPSVPRHINIEYYKNQRIALNTVLHSSKSSTSNLASSSQSRGPFCVAVRVPSTTSPDLMARQVIPCKSASGNTAFSLFFRLEFNLYRTPLEHGITQASPSMNIPHIEIAILYDETCDIQIAWPHRKPS